MTFYLVFYPYDLQKEMLGRIMSFSYFFISLITWWRREFLCRSSILRAKYIYLHKLYNNCNDIIWLSKAEVITVIYLLEYA